MPKVIQLYTLGNSIMCFVIFVNMLDRQFEKTLTTAMACKVFHFSEANFSLDNVPGCTNERNVVVLVLENINNWHVLDNVCAFKQNNPSIPLIISTIHPTTNLVKWCLRNRIWDCINIFEDLHYLQNVLTSLSSVLNCQEKGNRKVVFPTDVYKCNFNSRCVTRSSTSPALDFIRNNIHTKLSAEKLAKLCNLSGHVFSTIFKLENGSTLRQYIKNTRLQKSEDLILAGNMRIQQIAFSLGYDDVSHFNRVFKNKFGMTPTEYRRSKVLK